MENQTYEGDFRCQSNDGPEDPCREAANQCWREPYTPASFILNVCDEHAGGLKSLGYSFDAAATAELRRDVEREAKQVEELEYV